MWQHDRGSKNWSHSFVIHLVKEWCAGTSHDQFSGQIGRIWFVRDDLHQHVLYRCHEPARFLSSSLGCLLDPPFHSSPPVNAFGLKLIQTKAAGLQGLWLGILWPQGAGQGLAESVPCDLAESVPWLRGHGFFLYLPIIYIYIYTYVIMFYIYGWTTVIYSTYFTLDCRWI